MSWLSRWMLGPDLVAHEPIVESLLGCSAELKVCGWQVVDVLSERRQHLPGLVLPSQFLLGKALQRGRDEGVGQR